LFKIKEGKAEMAKDNAFFRLVEKNPLNAAYQIPEKEDQLQYLEKEQIQKIWAEVAEAISSPLVIGESKKLLFTSIRLLLQNAHVLAYLEEEALLKVEGRSELLRDILIALMRKNNPDAFSEFSYELIQQGGAEHNYLYMSGFVLRCDSLPIQSLISLGSKNLQVATLILKDIGSHADYFKISEGCLTHHPRLAEKIAKRWCELLQLYDYPEPVINAIKERLTPLQQKYPAFNQVKLDARIQHDHPIRQDLPQRNKGQLLDKVGVGVVICAAPSIIGSFMKIGPIAAAATSASLWPLVPALLPTFLAYAACAAGTRMLESYLQESTRVCSNRPRPGH